MLWVKHGPTELFLVQPRVIIDPKVRVNVLNLVAFHHISVINMNPFCPRTSTLVSQLEIHQDSNMYAGSDIGVGCLYDVSGNPTGGFTNNLKFQISKRCVFLTTLSLLGARGGCTHGQGVGYSSQG